MNENFLIARLWDSFQSLIGTNSTKKRYIAGALGKPGRVLEIGCATGNLSDLFLSPGYEYLGVDTDEPRIRYAQHRFSRYSNISFRGGDLFDMPLESSSFDYVILSATAHHIPDEPLARMFRKIEELLKPDGKFILLDMERPEPEEPFSRQFYYRLDRGEYVRKAVELEALLKQNCSFGSLRTQVLECRKFGIRVIDVILIEAVR